MKIGNFEIGKKTFIIAEIGSNHDGDFKKAEKMIKKAKMAGANAVKFQIYRAAKLASENLSPLPKMRKYYHTQKERFESLEFTNKQFLKLAKKAKKEKIIFLASVFDEDTVDFFDKILPAFKIASGDFTNLLLIRHIVKKKKPIILSTGLATLKEIELVVKEIPKNRLALLHCVSNYPASIEKANLLSIPFLKEKFGVPVGYSDHVPGSLACLVAVSLGAAIIEKHITLKKRDFGDHFHSLEPSEFKEMIRNIRLIESARGMYGKPPIEQNLEYMKKFLRRSLFAKIDIPKNTTINKNMLIALRPGNGISPLEIDTLIGKKAKRNIRKGEQLKKTDFL